MGEINPEVFKAIPGFSRYVISENGLLYDTLENRLVDYFFSEGVGYAKVSLKNDRGETVLSSRHRLLALTYIPQPVTDDPLIVNHRNGIKGDDRLSNLEWTTYQGNAWHAGASQLTTRCIPVLVYDFESGVETSYPSIVECANKLGLTKGAVQWRVDTDGQRLFPEMKLYKRLHSDTPWLEDRTGVVTFGRCREVVVRDLTNGNYTTYNSSREVARALNCTEGAVSQWLNKCPGYPVLPGLVQIKYASDENDFPEVDDPWGELSKHTKDKAVFCFEETTGKMFIYPSCASCARDRQVSPTNMNYKLKSLGGKVFKDGYRYGYYPDNTRSVLPATVK